MPHLPKILKIALCIISFVITSFIDAKEMLVSREYPEYEPSSMSSSTRGRSVQRRRSQSIPAAKTVTASKPCARKKRTRN